MKSVLNLLIGAIVIFIILYFLVRLNNDKFNKHEVCFTTSSDFYIFTGGDGQRMVNFTFILNDKEYKSSYHLNEEMENNIKDVLHIQYACDKPKLNKLVFPDKSSSTEAIK